MPITDWPKTDRPREKLLQWGEKSLTDAELIAIFLNTGMRGRTALDVAKSLMATFGSLKQLLLSSPPTVLMKTPGIGQAKYAALKAALELGRRCLTTQIAIGESLNNSRLAQDFLSDRLKHYDNEVFACLFMDTHFHFLGYEELFRGTVNEASIYPREIVRRGLSHNAAKIILAHNHPSGNPTPSPADRNMTRIIHKAAAMMDMEVVDHVIIGHQANFSFADKGLI